MDSSDTSQADEGSYQDPSYYDPLDSSLQDDGEQKSPLREQDRFLPIANVAKIMKKSVPNSGKIAKEAKECVQECVSEFISFITSEAAERCIEEKRKTVNGEDILYAVHTLGFDNYVDPLKKFLLKYRETSKLDTSMFDESTLPGATNTVLPGTVILSIPQTPVGLQAAANQPGSTPIAARPLTVIPTSENSTGEAQIITSENGTITIGGQQFTQPLIIQQAASSLAQPLIKQEEGDIKFSTTVSNASGTIILPVQAGQVLLNGSTTLSTANAIPVSAEQVAVTSSSA